MQIRKANRQDIASIVALLKTSLGEGLTPKSESLWLWKHLQNPFGESPVLLAEDDGQLIGVRAFLRWQFLQNGKTLNACRAVDTAIHPDYQGQGIFTKLTLSLIQEIEKEGIDLIYNTPNEKSMPGYLKMGWTAYKKLPLFLGILPNFPKSISKDFADWESVKGLISKLESSPGLDPNTCTRLVPGYIAWRYASCPIFQYSFLSDRENYLLIYRQKRGSWVNEFRIVDLFHLGELPPSARTHLNSNLTQVLQNSGCQLVSFSGMQNNQHLEIQFFPKLSLGPQITLRQVNPEINPAELPWSWSLGDLEVF